MKYFPHYLMMLWDCCLFAAVVAVSAMMIVCGTLEQVLVKPYAVAMLAVRQPHDPLQGVEYSMKCLETYSKVYKCFTKYATRQV